MIKHLKNRWLINKVISPPGSQKEPRLEKVGVFHFIKCSKCILKSNYKIKNLEQFFAVCGFYACYEQNESIIYFN